MRERLNKGYLESIYEKALMMELSLRNIQAQRQASIPVYYRNENIGDFYADILVENCLILELKATEHLSEAHEAQLVNYLTATGIEDGLLINSGGTQLEIKRKYKTYRPKETTPTQAQK